jgi:hypothetical protein
VASVIECIDLGCARNAMLVLICLTAPKKYPWLYFGWILFSPAIINFVSFVRKHASKPIS